MTINKSSQIKLKSISSFNKNIGRRVLHRKPELKIPFDKVVYIDRIKLQSQLLRIESNPRNKESRKAISKIYKIFDETMDRERAKGRFYSNVRVTYGDLVECFGGVNEIPRQYVKLDRESEKKVIIDF